MKKNFIICFSVLFTLSGCNYKDVNSNPNVVTSPTLPSLLTNVEVVSSYDIGGEGSQMNNIFMQYVSGLSTQPQAWDKYNVDNEAKNFFDYEYSKSLKDVTTMISNADALKLTVYVGFGKILLANSLGVLTDSYGDIPFSEGLKGETIPYPKYDKQQDVYAKIQSLLDEAIIALNAPNAQGLLPSTDDVIFKGNITKWIAAAYTLKAKYSLHLSKLNSTDAANNTLAALYQAGFYRGIASNADDMDLVFGAVVNQANPWYHWFLGRNDFRLGKVFIDLMKRVPVDPRLSYFAKPNSSGIYIGSIAGSGDAITSQLGDYYNKPNAPFTIVSFADAKFMEAEARVRIDINDPLAQKALIDAITASIKKVTGGSATANTINDYVTAFGKLSGTLDQQLQTIITQKYIAGFTRPEAWTDWRRTGYPILTASVGGVNGLNPSGEIPRRLPVPVSERLNNPNAPNDAPSLQLPRLYWDK
jgi:hypothetical protein